MSTSSTRDLASFTKARKPGLCTLWGVVMKASLVGKFGRPHLQDPPYARAHARQLRFDSVIAAIDVINPVDDGFSLRGQSGQHQGSAGAQIAGNHLCAG